MRILAIDHGTVRVGLALSDPLGVVARPLETVAAAHAIPRVAALVREHGIKTIVLGIPLRLDGSEGPAAARVRAFADLLRAALDESIAIVLRDESLTTLEAHEKLRERRPHRKPDHSLVDAAAAAVILQEFLDQPGPGQTEW